jgi:hypothetical protein
LVDYLPKNIKIISEGKTTCHPRENNTLKNRFWGESDRWPKTNDPCGDFFFYSYDVILYEGD